MHLSVENTLKSPFLCGLSMVKLLKIGRRPKWRSSFFSYMALRRSRKNTSSCGVLLNQTTSPVVIVWDNIKNRRRKYFPVWTSYGKVLGWRSKWRSSFSPYLYDYTKHVRVKNPLQSQFLYELSMIKFLTIGQSPKWWLSFPVYISHFVHYTNKAQYKRS